MWHVGQFYYALPKGKRSLSNSSEDFTVVKCVSQKRGKFKFKRIGFKTAVDQDHFDKVLNTPISYYVRLSKAMRNLITDPQSRQGQIVIKLDADDRDINRILKELQSLRDDLQGTISLTDPDRENKIQRIYSLLGKLESRGICD